MRRLILRYRTPRVRRRRRRNPVSCQTWALAHHTHQYPRAMRRMHPAHGIPDPAPPIRDRALRIPDPGPRIPDPGLRISDPGLRIPDPGPRIPDPGPRIPTRI